MNRSIDLEELKTKLGKHHKRLEDQVKSLRVSGKPVTKVKQSIIKMIIACDSDEDAINMINGCVENYGMPASVDCGSIDCVECWRRVL
jgi:hypothetical protein